MRQHKELLQYKYILILPRPQEVRKQHKTASDGHQMTTTATGRAHPGIETRVQAWA